MDLRVRNTVLTQRRQFAENADFARHRDPCIALFTSWEDAPGGTAPATGMTTIPFP